MNSRPRMSAPEVNGRHVKRPSEAASRSSYGAGFALDETRPLACFAGIWTNWTSVWKVNEGETTNDLYAFLTTEPNAEIGAIHPPKAMPVILTTPEEVETWMTALQTRP